MPRSLTRASYGPIVRRSLTRRAWNKSQKQRPERRRRWPSRRSMARHGSFWPNFRPPRGRREPRRHASRNVLFHRTEHAGARRLAPRTGGNLKRARGQGLPGSRQERSPGDSESPAGISTSHHCRLSQRLAAESTYFRISCRRRRSRRRSNCFTPASQNEKPPTKADRTAMTIAL